jgi:hypothetical protein
VASQPGKQATKTLPRLCGPKILAYPGKLSPLQEKRGKICEKKQISKHEQKKTKALNRRKFCRIEFLQSQFTVLSGRSSLAHSVPDGEL